MGVQRKASDSEAFRKASQASDKRLGYGILALDKAHEHHDDGDDEEKMQESAEGV